MMSPVICFGKRENNDQQLSTSSSAQINATTTITTNENSKISSCTSDKHCLGRRTPFSNLLSHFQSQSAQVPQIISIHPTCQILREGESVKIEASVTPGLERSINCMKTFWYKEKRLISDKSNLRYSIRELNGIRSLEIRDLRSEDSGTYKIVLENLAGKAECSVKLDVLPRLEERNSRSVEMKNYATSSTPGNSSCYGSSSYSSEESLKIISRPSIRTNKNQSITVSAPKHQKFHKLSPEESNQSLWKGEVEGRKGNMDNLSSIVKNSKAQLLSKLKTVNNNSSVQTKPKPSSNITPPFFLQHLKDMECTEGNRVELATKIRGAKEVIWMKNDERVQNCSYFKYSHDPSEDLYRLVIEDPFIQDSGIYTCEAYNLSGGSISFANLLVSEIQMKEEVQTMSELATDAQSSPMESKANIVPHPELSSQPNGTDILIQEEYSSSQSETEDFIGVPVAETKSQEELCSANGESPVLENTETGDFLEVPEAETKTQEELSTENDESPVLENIETGLLRKISHEVEHNNCVDEESPTDADVITEKFLTTEIVPEVQLILPELVEDVPIVDGQIIEETFGKAIVEYKGPFNPFSADENTGRSPSVMGPSYLIAMKDETLYIRIKYSGVPQSKVQWTKNGKPCEDVVENSELSSVRIDRVSYDDSGRYDAKISNDHGTILHHCFLSVEGPPEPPSNSPLAAYNESTNIISISWAGSPYDGGSILTGYIVQCSIDEQEWSDLSTGKLLTLTYTLHCPNPGSSYRFRVCCSNMYGIGTPSNVSPPVCIPGIRDHELEDTETKKLEELDVKIRAGSLTDFYTKGEELGKGRFGVVFKVAKKDSGELFAGKIIRCIKSADKVKVRQEVEIMNMLRHPKLLQIMDALENDKEICIITEKINGGELFERVVAEDFTLTEYDCVGFMRQICDAIKFMHSKSIIHLDLKPENILCLTRSTYSIKIIDFGLSQKYDESTPMRVLFGTPEFVAPEIINYEPISPASDMWALGVITYVLISGLSPFMGDSDSETFSNITEGLFDFDDESFEPISEDAKDFISKLLVRRKEKRMTAVDCLAHKWLAYPEPTKNIVIPTDKLKRFIIRRKWQKTGNAIRALGRITNLYSNRRSSEVNSPSSSGIFSRKSDDSGIFESIRPTESLSLEEESPFGEDKKVEELTILAKRQLVRQERLNSTSSNLS